MPVIALHIGKCDSNAPLRRDPSRHPAATGGPLRQNRLSRTAAYRRIPHVTFLICILYPEFIKLRSL